MFAVLIQTHSSLNQFWNWQTRVCDLKGIKKAMMSMSTGELTFMTKFFMGLWVGENVLVFLFCLKRLITWIKETF